MTSSYISNALQINFDSVLEITDIAEMVSMFKTLESIGLRGFLGCPSVLYERELEQFFDTTMVKDGDITCEVSSKVVVISEDRRAYLQDITCEVSSKVVVISEDRFAGVFGLPTEGLVNLSEVPKDLVYDARSIFSQSGEPISTYGKKRLMKYEYHLLNDILAKSLTVKAGKLEQNFVCVLKEMVDKTLKKAKGFAAQICVLLKSDSAMTMGDATTFPPLKILSAKTVKTYIATNKTIDARGKADDPGVAKIARSKKRQLATGDEPAVTKKKRTSKRKASSSKDKMEIVSVAQEAIPFQAVEPSTAVPAEQSDELTVDTIEKETVSTADEIDNVIAQVLAETAQLEETKTAEREQPHETDVGEETVFEGQAVEKADEMELWFNLSYEEFAARQADRIVESSSETDGEQETVAYETEGMELSDVIPTVEEKTSADEAMTVEEILLKISGNISLPSTIGEVTKIQLGKSISIPGVDEGDWYKASLPMIPAADKGKAPLLERDTLREKVIDEVDRFFNSFSFKKLENLKIEDIYAKEELVLSWAEADSMRVALHRRMYILTKYRELLIRKFLEARKSNFVPCEGSSSTDLKVLDWLSDLHLFVLEELKEHMLAHVRETKIVVFSSCICLLIGVARSSPGARLGDWVFTEAVLIKSSSGTFLKRKKGRRRILISELP
ncbi:hypothetical protein F511_28240 [Dorcoceras hygrometricum]|uniref:Uncharacterized protein n=1 Tax=Dorcoceras hygrometricum TaxID=472368 RepID=A0A2Z7D0L5_9LAMI|nr:hypothetical protein F511_28240 [Dorcoceras hygrometricum]